MVVANAKNYDCLPSKYWIVCLICDSVIVFWGSFLSFY